ncbi:MAG: SufE family protein [Ichthyobacteriaceae bacterium]|nr:SufE family protein [Ichthyobacteriaceae bacterium]
MTIQEKQNEILEDFNMFEDWMEKYDYIIEMGKSIPLIDEKYKTNEYLVKGCQSQAWIHAELDGDKIVYTADGDAILAKGVLSMLLSVVTNQNVKEVAESNFDFLQKIGLQEHLSPTRASGLEATIKLIMVYAKALNSKLK